MLSKSVSTYMRKALLYIFISSLFLTGCNETNNLLKSSDYDYKYEAAKQLYAEGHYNSASYLLQNVLAAMKGSNKGEESLYLLGLTSLKPKNYDAASTYFKKYNETYPKGIYAEEAKFNTGMALYLGTPEPKLDQTATYQAVNQFQQFLDAYPASHLRENAQQCIFELQDKLVEKQYPNAKLYYDLGSYIGNGVNGNYEACIITAENAIKDFPYTKRREDLAYLILKAKFDYAHNSIAQKQEERFNDAIDEYYGFLNEYPESKYLKDAKAYYDKTPVKYKRSTNN